MSSQCNAMLLQAACAKLKLHQMTHFCRIQGTRLPGGLDSTETAATSAGVAHQHDRGGGCVPICTAPALSYVRAAGLLTKSAQVQLPQVALDFGEFVATRESALQPVGLSCFVLQQRKLLGMCTNAAALAFPCGPTQRV